MNRILIVADGAWRSSTLALIASLRRIECDAVMEVSRVVSVTETTISLPKIDAAALAWPEPRRRKAQWKSELQGRRV